MSCRHWEYGSTDSCRAVAYADPSGTFSYLRGKGWGDEPILGTDIWTRE